MKNSIHRPASFLRCLAYKLALPEAEECAKLDFVMEHPMSDGTVYYTIDESAYAKGYIALRDNFVSDPLALEKMFGTRDYVLIGFPGARGTGGKVSTSYDFAVMNKTQAPDACWEALKCFFDLRDFSGISSLKSEYDKKMEEYRQSKLAHFADGAWLAFDADTPQEEIKMLAESYRRGVPYTFDPRDDEERRILETQRGAAADTYSESTVGGVRLITAYAAEKKPERLTREGKSDFLLAGGTQEFEGTLYEYAVYVMDGFARSFVCREVRPDREPDPYDPGLTCRRKHTEKELGGLRHWGKQENRELI